jgi:hypothetical protein
LFHHVFPAVNLLASLYACAAGWLEEAQLADTALAAGVVPDAAALSDSTSGLPVPSWNVQPAERKPGPCRLPQPAGSSVPQRPRRLTVEPALELADRDEYAPASPYKPQLGPNVLIEEVPDTPNAAAASSAESARRSTSPRARAGASGLSIRAAAFAAPLLRA